jgi:peptidyl-prolyl cis-trans isomerase C
MRVLASMALLAVLLAGACGAQGTLNDSAAGGDTSRVLATVGELNITEQMVNSELEKIPPYQRTAFESPEGRRMLVDHMVEQELLLTAARSLGLEQDSFVVAQVELAMQQVEDARDWALIQVYYQQQVVDAVTVPEEDILAYYTEHQADIYYQAAQVQASQIMVANASDTTAVKAALDGGTSFADAASTLSTHLPTAEVGGDMGWVTVDSPIPYLGNQPEISAALFAAAQGEVLGPFQTELGWHFFTVTGSQEEGSRPLDEVRESIENILKPARVNSYLTDELMPTLMVEYGVTINEEAFLPDEDMAPDSLLQAAQNMMETNPEAAVQYFTLFLERFPDHARAHQAQFLIGFTLSEQIGDYENARNAFQRVIDNYPESDFCDDAAWMIENMGVPPEELIFDEGAPEQEQPTGSDTALTT